MIHLIHWSKIIKTDSTPAFNHEAAAVDADYIATHLTEMILQLGLRGWRTETLEVLSRFLHQMLCSLQSLRPWKKLKTIEKFGFVPISSSIRELISHPLDILATLQASRQKIQRSGSPWWDLQVASRGRLGESPGYAKTLVQNQLNHDNRDNIYSWIRADSFFHFDCDQFRICLA